MRVINKERNREYQYHYREKHREEIRKRNREYAKRKREENSEKINKYQRNRRRKNRKAFLEYSRKYYQKNREHKLQQKKEYLKKIREAVIKGYGGKCACCEESHYEFLALDHKDGGGTKERKIIKTATLYRKVLRENFPPEYRILCHNCNSSLGYYGYCPHNLFKTKE